MFISGYANTENVFYCLNIICRLAGSGIDNRMEICIARLYGKLTWSICPFLAVMLLITRVIQQSMLHFAAAGSIVY